MMSTQKQNDPSTDYTPGEVPLGEQIAQAIESYLNPGDCRDVVECESCALVRQLAVVARSFAAPAPETGADS